MQRGFIRAKIISFDDLMAYGNTMVATRKKVSLELKVRIMSYKMQTSYYLDLIFNKIPRLPLGFYFLTIKFYINSPIFSSTFSTITLDTIISSHLLITVFIIISSSILSTCSLTIL